MQDINRIHSTAGLIKYNLFLDLIDLKLGQKVSTRLTLFQNKMILIIHKTYDV